MKTQMKWLVIGLTASILMLSGTSMAGQSKVPVISTSSERAANPKMEGDWAAFRDFKLSTLHAHLKLTPSQEAAWNEWTAKHNANHGEWKERRSELDADANLPVIQRMEKRLGFAKEHVSKLEQHIAATKAFYATLTPEQRAVFDKEANFGARGHGGKCRE